MLQRISIYDTITKSTPYHIICSKLKIDGEMEEEWMHKCMCFFPVCTHPWDPPFPILGGVDCI